MNLHQPIANYISAEILKDNRRAIGREEPLVSSCLIDSFSLVELALFVESIFALRRVRSWCEIGWTQFRCEPRLSKMIRS